MFKKFFATILFLIIIAALAQFTKVAYKKYRRLDQALQQVAFLETIYIKDNLKEKIIEQSFTDKKSVLELYQMMKDVHELFEKHKITYWISGGATVGVLRHQGLIPWDDDIDLNILHDDELKFQDLKTEFESLGYYFYQESLLYRISRKDNVFYHEPGFNSSIPFLEVYIMRKEQRTNKYKYANESLARMYPREYYYEDKLFPLKKYTYGSIEVWGPNDAEWYANNYYGNDWYKTARIDPKRNVKLLGDKPLYFTITEKFRHPAQPIGPLQNRINYVK